MDTLPIGTTECVRRAEAQGVKISPLTIARACREGRLEAHKEGRDWRIVPARLDDWITKGFNVNMRRVR